MENQNTFTSTPSHQATASAVPFGKFEGSKLIVKHSLAVLKQDTEILLFPILSALTQLIWLVSFVFVTFFFILGGSWEPGAFTFVQEKIDSGAYDVTLAFLGLIYYIITLSIFNFYQACIYLVVDTRFRGGDMTFGEAINTALSRILTILSWSVIAGTVGFILEQLSKRSGVLSKIVTMILKASWHILTFFSLPSLIIGKKSILESFQESQMIIRKTWGETIIVKMGAGFIAFLISLAIIISAIVLVMFSAAMQSVALSALIIFVAVISLIMVSIISLALDAIFKLALYEYARTGVMPSAFPAELMQAVSVKK